MASTPGILDFRLQLMPLKRISPSRYEGLKDCALREVWSAGQQPSLLPISPAARLGTVIHRLLQDSGSGYFARSDHLSVDARWTELLAVAEQEMGESWLERHFVPLRDVIPDFEVRRIRATNRALEISKVASPYVISYWATAPKVGTEFPVTSRDGSVAGRIDRVVMSESGPIIIDYKSGEIMEGVSISNPGVIKVSYELQLKLYAGLYAETTGIWPVRLEVISLSGEAASIDFDQTSSSRLVEDASTTLHQTNTTITSPASKPEIENQLARPTPQNCRYCLFRPGCSAYKRARANNQEDDSWPHDLTGTLDEIRVLGNSRLAIAVRPHNMPSSLFYVRGLNPALTRHPAIEHLQQGDQIGLYYLRSLGAGNNFSESDLTTIYKSNLEENTNPRVV